MAPNNGSCTLASAHVPAVRVPGYDECDRVPAVVFNFVYLRSCDLASPAPVPSVQHHALIHDDPCNPCKRPPLTDPDHQSQELEEFRAAVKRSFEETTTRAYEALKEEMIKVIVAQHVVDALDKDHKKTGLDEETNAT